MVDGIRVLIVESDSDIRLLLRLKLELEPYDFCVSEAVSAEEALVTYSEFFPDFIVSNVVLNRNTGFIDFQAGFWLMQGIKNQFSEAVQLPKMVVLYGALDEAKYSGHLCHLAPIRYSWQSITEMPRNFLTTILAEI
jgi:hypothetical protein